MWLLNDSVNSVHDRAKIYLEFDGKEVLIMEWSSGKVQANTNVMGNIIQYIIPETQDKFFKLKLVSENGYDNEYTFYIEDEEDAKSIIINE